MTDSTSSEKLPEKFRRKQKAGRARKKRAGSARAAQRRASRTARRCQAQNGKQNAQYEQENCDAHDDDIRRFARIRHCGPQPRLRSQHYRPGSPSRNVRRITPDGRKSGEAPSPDAARPDTDQPDRHGEHVAAHYPYQETTHANHNQPHRPAPQCSMLRQPPLLSPLLRKFPFVRHCRISTARERTIPGTTKNPRAPSSTVPRLGAVHRGIAGWAGCKTACCRRARLLLSAIASPEPCDGQKPLGAFWRDGRSLARPACAICSVRSNACPRSCRS
jgi:hypothetical protein